MDIEKDPSKRGATGKAWPTLRAKWKKPKNSKFANFRYHEPLGARVNADYLVPNTSASDDHRDTVFCLGWKFAATLEKREEIACMYASAMSAFAPELEDEFLISMKGNCIDLQRIFIPSEANAREIDMVLAEHEKYGPDETLVLFATGLLILFKDIYNMQEIHYKRLVANSINALRSKLGMLSLLEFPLTKEKACAVKSVFGLYRGLKAKMIRYLMSASKQNGNLCKVATDMLEALSWSEMNAFASIKEMLHESNSPVLQDPSIQYEVSAFYYAMKKVYKSEHPQFFWHFCDGLKLLYVERHNFPILAQVAETLKRYEFRASSSSEQLVAKPKETSPLVDRLVNLHRSKLCLKSS